MAAKKHNSVFLFLALACFLGIVIIFVADGYMGLYDSLLLDTGTYQQNITADQWARPERYGGSFNVGAPSNGKIDFTYTVENHRFSGYNAPLQVSLLYNDVNIKNVLSQEINTPAFGKQIFQWTIDSASLVTTNFTAGQNYYFNVDIKRGNITREVILNIYAAGTVNSIKIPPPQQ
jgi:hypothetical protein